MSLSKLTNISLASLGLIFGGLLSTNSPLQAQSNYQESFQITFNSQDPFNTESSPATSAGGASRGGGIESQCQSDSDSDGNVVAQMLPLTPRSAEKTSLTTVSHPTFYVYVPDTIAEQGFFSVMGLDNDYEYQTFLDLPEKSGVVSISLPNDIEGIEVSKNYRWSFVMICNEYLEPDSPLVDGQVKRVTSQVSVDNSISKEQRAAIYGQEGIWFDTIDNLAQSINDKPNDAQLEYTWTDLLSSVGLDVIATAPLLTE